jgi:hypothetical protein
MAETINALEQRIESLSAAVSDIVRILTELLSQAA